MKRWIVPILILLVVAVGGYFAFQQFQTQRAQAAVDNLQTVSVERGDLTATVGATGVVHSNQTVTLAWQTNGTVDQVLVAPGDQVQTDQVLATLLQTSLPQNVILAQTELTEAERALEDLQESSLAQKQALQAVAEAQRAVLDAQEALDPYDDDAFEDDLEQAEDDVVDRLEDLRDAEADLEPYLDLPADHNTRENYQEKVDDAREDYEEAVRERDSLLQERAQAQANLEAAEAQLADARRDYERIKDGPDPDELANARARVAAAQATLNQAQLTAPFAATITRVDVKPGDAVSPGTVAIQMDDLSHLLVDVQVSEVDINRIRIGQEVTLTFDAIPGKEYSGTVSDVDRVGTSNQGVVDFTVAVELTNADEDVRPGMTAAVNIVVNELEGVVLVPNRAVRVLEGRRVIYVLRAGETQAVPVTLGASSENNSELLDGELTVGDQVVLNPPEQFGQGGPPFGRP